MSLISSDQAKVIEVVVKDPAGALWSSDGWNITEHGDYELIEPSLKLRGGQPGILPEESVAAVLVPRSNIKHVIIHT